MLINYLSGSDPLQKEKLTNYQYKLQNIGLNLLLFSFYQAHCELTPSWDFVLLYQFKILADLLRYIGEYYLKSSQDQQFWGQDDFLYAKIILAYQILNAAYICWESRIHSQKNSNLPKVKYLMQFKFLSTLISKINSLEKPEFFSQNAVYGGSFNSINFKKRNLKEEQSGSLKNQKLNQNNIFRFFIQIITEFIENAIMQMEQQKSIEIINELNKQLQKNQVVITNFGQINYSKKECNFQKIQAQNIQQPLIQDKQEFKDFINIDNKIKRQNLQEYLETIQSDNCKQIEQQQFKNQETGSIIIASNLQIDKNFDLFNLQIYFQSNSIQSNQNEEIQLQKKQENQSQISLQQNQQSKFQINSLQVDQKREIYQNQISDKIKELNEQILKLKSEQNELRNQDQEKCNLETTLTKLKESNQNCSLENNQSDRKQELGAQQELQNFIHQQKKLNSQKQINDTKQKFENFHLLQKSKTIQEESFELKIKNKFQRAFSFGSADFQSQSENEVDHQQLEAANNQQNTLYTIIEEKDVFPIPNKSEDKLQEKNQKINKLKNRIFQLDRLKDDESEDEKSHSQSQFERVQIADQNQNEFQNSILDECILNITLKQDEVESISSKLSNDQNSFSIQSSFVQDMASFQNISQKLSKKIKIKKSRSQFDIKNLLIYRDDKQINQIQNLRNKLPQGNLQQNVQDQLEQIIDQIQNNNQNNHKKLSDQFQKTKQFDSSELQIPQPLKKLKTLKNFSENENFSVNKLENNLNILKQLIDHYENKIEQKETALEFIKQKVKDLEFSLDSNKIFLNMVVHDMRNPTNQVEYQVSETLKQLKDLKKQINTKLTQLQNFQKNKENILIQQSEQAEIHNREINEIQIQENQEQIILNEQNIVSINIDLPNNLIYLQALIQNGPYIMNKNIEEKYEIFRKRKLEIDKQLIERYQLEINKNYLRSNSIEIQIKQKFESIKIRYNSPKSQRYNITKQQNINNRLILYKNTFEKVELRKKEIMIDSDFTVKTIKNKIEIISNQKKQFYNQINYTNQKFRSQAIYEEEQKEEIKQTVVQQAFGLVSKFKNEILNSLNQEQAPRRGCSSLPLSIKDQEPKVIKKKLKNLHLSYDPQLILSKLSQQFIVQTNIIEMEIISEKIVQKNRNFDHLSQNYVQNELKMLEEFIQDLDQSIDSLENCKYCSVMLLNLINDMMDLAKTEQMKFELNCEFFDLTKTIQRAFETLSYYGKQKNIKPQLKVDKSIEPFFKNLYGDEGRFSQIFLNFLSNAFKFTPQNGNIILELCQSEDQIFFQKKINQKINKRQSQQLLDNQIQSQQVNLEVGQNQDQIQELNMSSSQESLDDKSFQEYYISFQMKITDSGLGISKENVNKLFLNFGKLADPSGQNKQGTGLGLSICKHLIEKMGGKVKALSEGIGKGTTFVIKMQAISKIPFDQEDQMSSLLDQSYLSQQQKVSSAPSKELSDIIKEQKEALIGARVDCHHQQVNIIIDKLCPQVKQAIQNSFNQEERKKESSKLSLKSLNNADLNLSESIKRMRVLIINDEFFILQMLKMMVKKLNIEEIDTAQNGYDGFNMVIKKQYDFIICDLNMPVMDGFECAQKINEYFTDGNSFFQKQSELESRYCPYLVACSALITKEIYDKANLSGFELVVQSPLTIQMLRDQIIVKSIEKKAIIKKGIQQSFKQEKQVLKKPFYQEDENSSQNSQIQILIEKLESKLRHSQKRKNQIDNDLQCSDELSEQSLSSSDSLKKIKPKIIRPKNKLSNIPESEENINQIQQQNKYQSYDMNKDQMNSNLSQNFYLQLNQSESQFNQSSKQSLMMKIGGSQNQLFSKKQAESPFELNDFSVNSSKKHLISDQLFDRNLIEDYQESQGQKSSINQKIFQSFGNNHYQN